MNTAGLILAVDWWVAGSALATAAAALATVALAWYTRNLAIQTRAAVAAAQRETDLTVQAVTAATATAAAANRQVVLATAQANETNRLVQLEQERRGEELDDRHSALEASRRARLLVAVRKTPSLSVW